LLEILAEGDDAGLQAVASGHRDSQSGEVDQRERTSFASSQGAVNQGRAAIAQESLRNGVADEEGTGRGSITRRTALKGIAAGTAIAWTVPAVMSFQSVAAAASAPGASGCVTCDAVACEGDTRCGPPGIVCFCSNTNGGTGACGCLDASAICPLPACATDADCASGSHCYNTCGGCTTESGRQFLLCIPDCPATPRFSERPSGTSPLVRVA
jgi:hypothetical protein